MRIAFAWPLADQAGNVRRAQLHAGLVQQSAQYQTETAIQGLIAAEYRDRRPQHTLRNHTARYSKATRSDDTKVGFEARIILLHLDRAPLTQAKVCKDDSATITLPIIPTRSNRKVPVYPDHRRFTDNCHIERVFGKLKQQGRIATR